MDFRYVGLQEGISPYVGGLQACPTFVSQYVKDYIFNKYIPSYSIQFGYGDVLRVKNSISLKLYGYYNKFEQNLLSPGPSTLTKTYILQTHRA